MAALAGCVSRGDAMVDPGDVDRMLSRLSHRREKARSTWCAGRVAFGQLSHEGLDVPFDPRTHVGPRVAVCLAGRLDNREEFPGHFQFDDASLIAHAYEAEGDRSFAKLVGEFVFALWDARASRLVCVRDAIGIKPLYYSLDSDAVRFASELSAIFACPAADRSVNEAMAAEYLACRITSATDTLFSRVRRLAPAHALAVSADGIRTWRYWSIDERRQLRCRSDEEYGEAFREVFDRAVGSRLRGVRKAGITLSGGVDSSSVAATAVDVLRWFDIPCELRGFSLAFPNRPCDERTYLNEVARHLPLDMHVEEGVPPSVSEAAVYAAVFGDFPGYPNVMMFDRLRRSAAALGYTVLLTGEGGDDWFGGSYFHYADLLRARDWRGLYRQWRSDAAISGREGVEFPAFRFLRLGLWPLMAPGLRNAIRRVVRRAPGPPWVDRTFAASIGLPQRTEGSRSPSTGMASRDHQLAALRAGVDAHYYEVAERSAALSGVEERHPFSDRRVVEFAFSLPEAQRWQGEFTRYVVRTAMGNRIPESVRQRKTKAHFAFAYAEALGGISIPGRTIASRRWIRNETLSRMKREMLHCYAAEDESYTNRIWPLWMAAGIDLWLAASHQGAERTLS